MLRGLACDRDSFVECHCLSRTTLWLRSPSLLNSSYIVRDLIVLSSLQSVGILAWLLECQFTAIIHRRQLHFLKLKALNTALIALRWRVSTCILRQQFLVVYLSVSLESWLSIFLHQHSLAVGQNYAPCNAWCTHSCNLTQLCSPSVVYFLKITFGKVWMWSCQSESEGLQDGT